jgi:murein DD-endopeptidase MepM/ murein hydrolase activator NlpD
MDGYADNFLYRIRFVIVVLLILASLLSLPFLLSLAVVSPPAHAASVDPAVSTSAEDSPNVITSGVFNGADSLSRVTNSTQKAIDHTLGSVTNFIAAAGAQSGRLAAHGVSSGVSITADAVSGGWKFAGHTTGKIFGFITNFPTFSQIIRPADSDKTPVPVINADAPEFVNAEPAAPAIANSSQTQPADSTIQWPLHGAVTLEFGASDMPFQRIHTGIDISDGGIGTTPIHPFKAGVVVQAVYSAYGLGNHIVVDHGGGITSVYGHLASISIKIGQSVDTTTILGYEGSTGASTGPHLHFEIRTNGQPQNPRKFVNGQP